MTYYPPFILSCTLLLDLSVALPGSLFIQDLPVPLHCLLRSVPVSQATFPWHQPKWTTHLSFSMPFVQIFASSKNICLFSNPCLLKSCSSFTARLVYGATFSLSPFPIYLLSTGVDTVSPSSIFPMHAFYISFWHPSDFALHLFFWVITSADCTYLKLTLSSSSLCRRST